MSRRTALSLLVTLPVIGLSATATARDIATAASRSATLEPRLSRAEQRYVGSAWLATVTHDPACRGFHGREFTRGSPGTALTSKFAILRRPAVPARRLRSLLQVRGGVWSAGAQLYMNQIRRARAAFGATFYVIPAGNVSGQRGVPKRCGPEQVAVLRHRLSHFAAPRRARILGAQSRYLAYLRSLALRAGGVCATFTVRRELGDNFGCATLTDFGEWGVLADTNAYIGGAVAVFWTVVPDGIASVTLRFGDPHGATITVRAVNNVVVARDPFDAPAQSGFPSTIVLRAADGHAVRDIAVTPNMPTLCGYGC